MLERKKKGGGEKKTSSFKTHPENNGFKIQKA